MTPGRPLRILVVNWLDRENPKSGGAEAHLHETFGRLASRGHSVTALVSGAPGLPPRADLDGIDVHRAGSRNTFSFAAPRYFREHLAGDAFDVIVEDLNKVPVFTPWWSETPTVLLVHHLFGRTAFQAASVPVALVTIGLEQVIPRVYRNVPTIAVSESTREDLALRGLDPAHIEVVPNGIDLERHTPGGEEERFEEPTLVFLGRLNRYKRLDLVLRALVRLEHRGIRARLLVAGSGPERDAWEEQAAKLGIADRVEFRGFVPEAHKLDLLRRSWLHVLTSAKEGWGISNLEAGACGTPTVASDAPGLRESVVDGETGVLVPHGDVAALSDALAELLTDDALRRRMGRAARRFAERYSWDVTADGVERALRQVVSHPRPGWHGSPGVRPLPGDC